MLSKLISLTFPRIAGQPMMVLPSLRTIQALVACDEYGQRKGRTQDICIVQMDWMGMVSGDSKHGLR